MSAEPKDMKIASDTNSEGASVADPTAEPQPGPSNNEILEGIAKMGSRDWPRPRMSTAVESEANSKENLAKMFFMNRIGLARP